VFGLKTRKPSELEPEVELSASTDGRLIYAIGDIHGRLDLLEALLRKVAKDAGAARVRQRPVLVFLGDYVDRGPSSKGVIDCIMRLSAVKSLEVRSLKGNHEQAMLDFLDDPEFGPTWVQYGGGPTLTSYGVTAPQGRQPEAWIAARDALAQAVPAHHLRFLTQLELSAQYGDYFFVHAGLRPGVPIEAQTEQDMLWIRDEFLDERRPFDKVVVHGHSPEAEPVMNAVRIGLDTGAYATGVLTAARLFDRERGLIQTQKA